MKIKSSENKFYLFCLFVYALLTFIGVLYHEPNRDEAQAWLIVRDLKVADIFSELSVKGHPGLWYLILLPFAKLGFPYLTMHIIHWLISVAATGLFLLKAPLNKFTKLFFVFSYYMIFEYTIVARNYGLTVLLLFLIATFYESRFKNPYRYVLLLFALYNCNLHSFGAAVALSIIYVFDGYKAGLLKSIKFPLLILVGGLLSFVIQLLPTAGLSGDSTIHSSYLFKFDINTIWVTLTGIQNAFIPVTAEYQELKVAMVFTIVLCLFLLSFIRKPSVFIFLIISCCWLFYIFAAKLTGSWRHHGVILVFIIFSLWIADYYPTRENKITSFISRIIAFSSLEKFLVLFLTICLFINMIFGISTIRKEYTSEFSGSKSMANYIINHGLESSEIACYRSWRASGLAPYLPHTKFWFIDRKEYGTYFILDSIFNKYGDSLTEKEVLSRTKEKYNKEAMLLLNEPLALKPEEFQSELVFETNKLTWGADDENFLLYRITFSN